MYFIVLIEEGIFKLRYFLSYLNFLFVIFIDYLVKYKIFENNIDNIYVKLL